MTWWRGKLLRALQFNIEDPYGYYAGAITAESIISSALKVNANTIIVFARDPWGRVFYRGSRIYPRHPTTRLNLEDLISMARDKGLNVIIMVNHTANRHIYRAKPEYAQRSQNGEVIVLEHFPMVREIRDPQWPQICPNSPALEEYFIPEAMEATSILRPEGILLDSFRYIPDISKACYCKYCRDKFKKEYGIDLPNKEDDEDPAFRLALKWRYKVQVEAMRRIRDAVKSVKSDILFAYNNHPLAWAGRANIIVEKARDILDSVFAEASEFDMVDYSMISMAIKLSRALIGSGKPVLASRNLFYILRTVQSAPRLAIVQGIRTIVAAGGHPIATIFSSQFIEDTRSLDYLSEVYSELDKIEDFLINTEPIRYATILFSSNTYDMYFWDKPDIYISELEGMYEILTAHNYPVDFLSLVDLKDKIEDYSVIVAPSTAVLNREDENILESYIENGGLLIATGDFGLMRPDYTYTYSLALEHIMGLYFEGILRANYSYLHLKPLTGAYRKYWEGLPEHIILGDQSVEFRRRRAEKGLGDLIRARPITAEVLALGMIAKAPYGYEYTLGRSTPPPDSTIENIAGIALSSYEKGTIIYYAAKIGAHYSRLGHPDYAELIIRPLRKHAPQPPVIVEGPETIQAEYYKQKDRIIVHIVNHTYNQRILTAPSGPSKQALPRVIPPYSVHPPRIIIPVHNIKIKIALEDQKEYTAYNAITDEKLKIEGVGSNINILIDKLEEYMIVVIEPKH
ncbi:MAG: beta-galactosidase trimerization domain-containing protein [Acidilobaceae archaeon]